MSQPLYPPPYTPVQQQTTTVTYQSGGLLSDIERTLNGGSKTTKTVTVTTPTAAPVVNQLPRGWEQRVDQQGRTFFVDHNTKTV